MTFRPRCRRNQLDQRKRRNAGHIAHFRRLKKKRKLTPREQLQLEAHELISERLRA